MLCCLCYLEAIIACCWPALVHTFDDQTPFSATVWWDNSCLFDACPEHVARQILLVVLSPCDPPALIPTHSCANFRCGVCRVVTLIFAGLVSALLFVLGINTPSKAA